MKGRLQYQSADPYFYNSEEGWFINNEEPSSSILLSQESIDKINSGEYNIKSGDIVEYKVEPHCFSTEDGKTIHSAVAHLILDEKPVSKVFLIDIDGTICDDIKNEDNHLYPTANHFPNALDIINKWYDEGNVITFFTARESKDREVTETWLKEKGFKYHGLVTDKPRIKDDQEYVWIDNRKVRAVTYLGTWSELTEVDAKIKVFQ